jgi:zinc finger SWIM domain-containing protein 3
MLETFSTILVSPIAEQIQELIANHSRHYRFHSSNVAFEIKSGVTTVDYLVNIELRTCSCHAWQSTGFPCGHALAILMALRHDPQKYTMPFFTLEYYRKTYENAIMHPLTGDYSLPLQPLNLDEFDEFEDISDVDEDSLLPPSTRRPTGRPRKRRIRDAVEKINGAPRRQNRCGRCGDQDHIRRTCSNAI